jgi:hypothetical protein
MTMKNLVDAILGIKPQPHTQPQPHYGGGGGGGWSTGGGNPAEKALEEKAKHHPDLHWRTSIVDLLKLVGQDSNLQAREKLAKELGYPGKPGGEPAMNEFLHKKVMEHLGIK